MEEALPKEFDLIVSGTGFTESAVAAAASRIGKTVLHIDPNDFYGSCWASFNLENFQSFLANKISVDVCVAKQTWHIPEGSIEVTPNDDDWTQKKLLESSRRFNIDLTPKILFSAGKLVELLVSSNICRYAEFRAIDQILTLYQGELLTVPCSRTDVFNTKDLSIVEKRLLMKLLTSCISYNEKPEDFEQYQNKPFLEYLKANHLTDKIIHCVMHSIAMCDESTLLHDGVEKMKNYLNSLGRYGNSPFLFPMYGCGEIPQCFCRLCAVFGGTYCLKKQVAITKVEEAIVSLQIDDNIIEAKNAVFSNESLPTGTIPSNVTREGQQRCGNLARGVFIACTPIGKENLNAGGGVNVIRLTDNNRGAILLELSHYSGTCPKGLYLIHITCEAIGSDPEANLKPFADQIFNAAEAPKLLYSAYFLITRCKFCQASENGDSQVVPSSQRIFSTCSPFFEIDYDSSIQNAKKIFEQMYPNEEFLPRAPDPEEIVMGDEDPIALTECNLPDDLRQHIDDIEEGMETMDVCDGDAIDAMDANF